MKKETESVLRAARCIPMGWLAGCTSRQRRLVTEAFTSAAAELVGRPAGDEPGSPLYVASSAVATILRGVDPRGGLFIDQARQQAGILHDAAVRAALEDAEAGQ